MLDGWIADRFTGHSVLGTRRRAYSGKSRHGGGSGARIGEAAEAEGFSSRASSAHVSETARAPEA